MNRLMNRPFFKELLKSLIPPRVSGKKPKCAIQFLYYKELELCISKIKQLRLFNPGIEIHGIFGADDTNIEYYEELQKHLDSNWQHPPAETWWKWANPDLMVLNWFKAHGKNLDWDFLYRYDWDMFTLEPLTQIMPPKSQHELIIFPEAESYALNRAWNNHWMDDENGKFQKFKAFLQAHYQMDPATINEHILFGNCYLICWPRSFLAAWADITTVPELPGMLEYRIPSMAAPMGYKLSSPEHLKSRNYTHYANTGKREIPTFTIVNELETARPFPVYHPVYTAFDEELINKYFILKDNKAEGRLSPDEVKQRYQPDIKPFKNYAILYLYYREFAICQDRLKILRKLNPGVPIYGLFAGEEMSYTEMMEMETYFDDHWCYPKVISKHINPGIWKKWNPDYLTAAWYQNCGKDLAWDFLFCHPWDLLMLEPVEKFANLPSQDDVLIYPEPIHLKNPFQTSSLITFNNKVEYVFFKAFVEEIIEKDLNVLASEAHFATWSRKALEILAPSLHLIPGKMQYRLPTLLNEMGFKFAPTPNYQPKLLTSQKQKIPLKTILSTSENPLIHKLFHPVYSNFTLETLDTYWDIMPSGHLFLKPKPWPQPKGILTTPL